MNEQLQQLLTDNFDAAMKYVQATGNFIAEQAPLLVQEILRYGLCEAIIGTSITVSLTVVCVWAAFKAVKAGFEEILVVPSIGAIVSGVSAVFWILDLCKVLFAPRLYLLEQLRCLIN